MIQLNSQLELTTNHETKSYSTFPRPAPIIALVGVSISGMPGPPLGPSPLITTTFPWDVTQAKIRYHSSTIKSCQQSPHKKQDDKLMSNCTNKH